MKKNLIVYTSNIGKGGMEKMSVEFLKSLDVKKYNILFLIRENKGDENIYESEIPQGIKVKYLTDFTLGKKIKECREKKKNLIYKLKYSFLMNKRNKIALENIKKELEFADVIIDYSSGFLRFANKLDLQGKNLIGWSHVGTGELKSKNDKKELRRIEGLKKYSYNVVINDLMEKNYPITYPFLKGKIYKLYNFLDYSVIKKQSNQENELTKDEKELINKDYILTLGSLVDRKKVDFLIRSYSEAKKNGLKEKFYILGEGKEKEKLLKLIKSLNLVNDVKILDFKKNPYIWLKHSKLYILGSISEGLPTVLIEAMYFNKVIVATKAPGVTDILLGGRTGILIENRDEESFGKAMVEGLKEEVQKKYQEEMKKRVEEFSLEKGKERIDKFLEGVFE
ncbi:MAG: glycosyltransferase, partial [Psychrilyobacter sp.]|uniref:glycosyltransferase n=1 Tax=Psychrilyobacter sp. TaxID=2586924 RepID=UPI003C768BFA